MAADLLSLTNFVVISANDSQRFKEPNPWGLPSLADPSCWNTVWKSASFLVLSLCLSQASIKLRISGRFQENMMAGSVPVSCTGLRYSHSASFAGALTVDKWTRRSCDDGSRVSTATDANQVEVEMTVGKSR